jgi:hypothetical protein
MSSRNSTSEERNLVQSGKVSFFGVMMVLVLVIAAFILIMVIREVLQKEKVTLTVQVKNDIGYPMVGVGISIDGQQVAFSDSNGIYIYTYLVDQQGQRRVIKAELTDYETAEESVTLASEPKTLILTLNRSLANLTIIVVDSLSNMPIGEVYVYLGGVRIDSTNVNGIPTTAPLKVYLRDTSVIKLEKDKYDPRVEYLFVDNPEQSLVIKMTRTIVSAPPPPKKASPMAIDFFTREVRHVEEPKIQRDITPETPVENTPEANPLVIDTTMPPVYAAREDSALIYMTGGEFRRALDIYLELTGQRQWQARADLWLYSADCALHMASDATGNYSEGTIDSALGFLDEAERYQNKIEEDIFPAVVQLKKGEAWAYKCELPAARSAARLQEFRQKALFYLRNSITQMQNRQYMETDFYKFAVSMRDEIGNR